MYWTSGVPAVRASRSADSAAARSVRDAKGPPTQACVRQRVALLTVHSAPPAVFLLVAALALVLCGPAAVVVDARAPLQLGVLLPFTGSSAVPCRRFAVELGLRAENATADFARAVGEELSFTPTYYDTAANAAVAALAPLVATCNLAAWKYHPGASPEEEGTIVPSLVEQRARQLALNASGMAGPSSDHALVEADEILDSVPFKEVTYTAPCTGNASSTQTLATGVGVASTVVGHPDTLVRSPLPYNMSNGDAVDTTCSAAPGSSVQGTAVHTAQCVPSAALIGARFSASTLAAASMAAMLGTPILSPTSGAPELRDRFKYPTFARLVPSTADAIAVAALVAHLGWDSVCVLRSRNDYWAGMAGKFEIALEKFGVGVAIEQTLSDSSTTSELDPGVVRSHLSVIRNLSPRVFVVVCFFEESSAATVMAVAADLGMNAAPWTMVSYGVYTDPQVTPLIEGMVGFARGTSASLDEREHPDGGPPPALIDFAHAYSRQDDDYITSLAEHAGCSLTERTNEVPHVYVVLTYDATRFLVRAVRAAVAALGLGPEDEVPVPIPGLMDVIVRTTMDDGATGPVILDDVGDRIEALTLFNVVGGQYLRVGTVGWDAVSGATVPEDLAAYNVDITTQIVWRGGGTATPPSRPQFTPWVMASAVRGVAGLLCVVGALAAVVTAGGIVYLRNERIIQWSSPVFGLALCLGVGLNSAATSVLVFGSDTTDMSVTQCSAQLWMQLLGAVLVFGSLFARTYRVGKLFNARGMRKVVVTDGEVGRIVLGITGIAVLYLTVWQVLAARTGTRVEVATRSAASLATFGEGAVGVYYFECLAVGDVGVDQLLSSGMLFLLVVIMVWGATLAYATRDVPAGFNEARNIGFSIYNAIVIFGLLSTVALLLRSNPDMKVLTLAVAYMEPPIFALAAVFGPKFLAVRAHRILDTRMYKDDPEGGQRSLGGDNDGATRLGADAGTSTGLLRGKVKRLQAEVVALKRQLSEVQAAGSGRAASPVVGTADSPASATSTAERRATKTLNPLSVASGNGASAAAPL